MSARILIVEDDRPILSLLTTVIERAGHTVVAKPDGSTALEYLRHNRPDLAVFDLSLGSPPSGTDLMRYVTQAPHLDKTVIVVLSVNPRLPPELYQTNRIARVLAKPARPTDITTLIDTLLKENA